MLRNGTNQELVVQRHVHHHLDTHFKAVFVNAELRMMVRVIKAFVRILSSDQTESRRHVPAEGAEVLASGHRRFRNHPLAVTFLGHVSHDGGFFRIVLHRIIAVTIVVFIGRTVCLAQPSQQFFKTVFREIASMLAKCADAAPAKVTLCGMILSAVPA